MNRFLSFATLIQFRVECERAGLTVPTAINRALHLLEVAQAHQYTPDAILLDMTEEQVRERVEALSIREHQGFQEATRGMLPGIDRFTEDLLAEVRYAIRPNLDEMIEELRPRFEQLAAPLHMAARDYGFTVDTSKAHVLDLADEAAATVWRRARTALTELSPIMRLRITISSLFDLSPTAAEMTTATFGLPPEHVDYTAAFAAADNWATDGAFYIDRKLPGHIDWLAMAVNGITLNTPEQVRAKLLKRRRGEDAERLPSLLARAEHA